MTERSGDRRVRWAGRRFAAAAAAVVAATAVGPFQTGSALTLLVVLPDGGEDCETETVSRNGAFSWINQVVRDPPIDEFYYLADWTVTYHYGGTQCDNLVAYTCDIVVFDTISVSHIRVPVGPNGGAQVNWVEGGDILVVGSYRGIEFAGEMPPPDDPTDENSWGCHSCYVNFYGTTGGLLYFEGHGRSLD